MTELCSEVIRIIKGLQEKKVNGIKSLHKMKLISKRAKNQCVLIMDVPTGSNKETTSWYCSLEKCFLKSELGPNQGRAKIKISLKFAKIFQVSVM